MRYTSYLFLLILALSSCSIYGSGSGKLRYVRSNNGEIAIVERSEKGNLKTNEAIEQTIVLEVNDTPELSPEQNEDLKDHASNETFVLENKSKQSVDKHSTPNDLNPDLDGRIVDEAYEAERAANTSFILMLVGLISAFAPYLGIIPFIIGLIFYSKSDRSRYITQYGERKQRSAQVVMIIDTVILSLWLLLIVALFFL